MHVFPYSFALVFIALMGAAIAMLIERPRFYKHSAYAVAGLNILLSTLATTSYALGDRAVQHIDAWVVRPHLTLKLGLDGMGTILVLATSIIYLCIISAAPKSTLAKRHMVSLGWMYFGTVGVLCSRDLASMTLCWLLSLVPPKYLNRLEQGSSTAGRDLLWGAALPGTFGMVLVGSARAWVGHSEPWSIDALSDHSIPLGLQVVAFSLLMIAVLTRSATLPLHGWLSDMAKNGPLGQVVLLTGSPLGMVLFLRVVAHLMPDLSHDVLPYIGWLGLLSTVVGALVATHQNDLRRIISFMMISQSGLAFVGLASLDEQGVNGALLQSLTTGLGAGGLLLLAWSLADRTGSTHVVRLGGLVSQCPRMAGLWFTLGIVTIGIPGTLGFVAEDLLVQGILHRHPFYALAFLLATALNAIAFLRAYFRAFLGPAGSVELGALPVSVPDLLPRERLVALGLISLLIGAGLHPQPLLTHTESTVATMLSTVWAETRPSPSRQRKEAKQRAKQKNP